MFTESFCQNPRTRSICCLCGHPTHGPGGCDRCPPSIGCNDKPKEIRQREIPEAVFCRWLRRKGIPVTHCSSCHTDVEWGAENNGYLELPHDISLGKGRTVYVCCDVFTAWEKG